jgi:hypothetical protein
MKKIFFSVLAMAMLSGAVYANNGKKKSSKKAKGQKCNMTKCTTSSSCNPANCVPLPGCCKK